MTITTLAIPNPADGASPDVSWAANLGWQGWLNILLGGLLIFLIFKLAIAGVGLHRAKADNRPGEQDAAQAKLGWALGALAWVVLFGVVLNIIFLALG